MTGTQVVDVSGEGDALVLAASEFHFTPKGLIVDGAPAYETWAQVGRQLQYIEGAVHWWIGDWLNYGERAYGETYSQAMEETPYSYGTLRNDKFVAGRIELSRRRDNVPFSHHAEVAALPPAQQDVLLDKAEVEGLTREKLRRAVREMPRLLARSDLPDSGERYRLVCADIADARARIEPASVDVIITDPPYPREYLGLYGDLAELGAWALKPGGSLLAMCGQSYLPDIMALMTPHLCYHWTVSYLTPGGQAVQLWDRKVNTFWKPVLWFVKGDYAGDWIGDVAKSAVNDNDKRFHDWGQSESGMADLVDRFSRPGDVILDPFVGAGTTGVVALQMGRRFIGMDVDANAIETTRARIAGVVNARS